MRKRFQQMVRVVLVNAMILLIGVVVLEAVFGGWFRSGALNRLNVPKDCVREYDVSELYRDPNPIIRYSRDEFGLRGSHRHPGEIDILTVGGSTTDQRYIRDGETWQDVLQSCLHRGGLDLVVGNAGVDGQSTYGNIKNFDWWFSEIPRLKPDYVLCYVGLNDFYKEAEYGEDELVATAKPLGLKGMIRKNSVLWHLATTFRGTYTAVVVQGIGHRAIDFNQVQWTREALQTNYGFMDARLAEYANRLRILADKTEQFGAKAIFVSQPCRWYRKTADGIEGQPEVRLYGSHEYNGVDLHRMMDRLDQVTAMVAAEKEALFVDLAKCNIWVDQDYYDFAHMTPSGAKKVGEQLATELLGALKEKSNGIH